MKKMKLKKLTAVALSAALMVSAVSMSASAIALDDLYDLDEVPTSTISVDSTVLSGATAAANTTLLSILGINVTSTDAAGVYNSAGTNGQSAPINLQMFGSDWNAEPDPYYYNFYYNLVYTTADGTTVGNVVEDGTDDNPYSGWLGDYTLIYSSNKSGPSGAANGTISSLTINNTQKTNINPAFFYEPDVLFSGATLSSLTNATSYSSTAYDSGLSSYLANYYDEDDDNIYNPLIVGGWNTSQYCANSGTSFSNIESMASGIVAIASAIESNTSKTGRYGDISDIADQLYAFSVGVHEYAETKGYTTAYYCFNPTYDGTYVTLSAVSGRYAQYLDGIGTDYYTVVGSTSIPLDDFISLVDDGLVVFDAPEELVEDAEIESVTLPTTVYGMTMQSADNMLGTAYCFAALYGKDSSTLPNIYDVLAYWLTYFYHIDVDGKDDNGTYLNQAMSLMLGGEEISGSEYHTNYVSRVNLVSGYTASAN